MSMSIYEETVQSNSPEPRAVPAEETALFYRNEGKEAAMGCIGYLRGDFGRNGKEFWTTWFDQCAELKTQEFKDEFDTVINRLREGGMLGNRSALSEYCRAHPDAKLESSRGDEYGFRMDTKDHSYCIRGMLTPGDYNFYCMCYRRDTLEEYLCATRQEQSDGSQGMTMGGM